MLFCHLLWCVGPKDRSLSVRTLYCPVQEAEDTEVRIHRGHSQVLRVDAGTGAGRAVSADTAQDRSQDTGSALQE